MRNLDVAIAEALDLDVIARAVNRFDRFLALDRDVHHQPLNRLAREFLRAERIGKLDKVALALAKLRVAHGHLAVGARGDRKDARAVEPSTHVFEKGGVSLGADDFFVDAPGFVLGKQPAGQLAAIDHEHEVLDRPFLGKREQEFGFELSRPGIVEGLGDLNLGDLVAHPAVDADLADLVGMADRDRRPAIDDDPLRPGRGDELARENEGRDEADPPTAICPHRRSSRRLLPAARPSPAAEFRDSAQTGRAASPFALVIARKLPTRRSARREPWRGIRASPFHLDAAGRCSLAGSSG